MPPRNKTTVALVGLKFAVIRIECLLLECLQSGDFVNEASTEGTKYGPKKRISNIGLTQRFLHGCHLFVTKKTIYFSVLLACIFFPFLIKKATQGEGKTHCGSNLREKNILLAVASSLQPAFSQLQPRMNEYLAMRSQQHPPSCAVRVRLNFASSGKLLNQVLQGAPIDVVVLASAQPVAILENKKLLERKITLFTNRLILAAPAPKYVNENVNGNVKQKPPPELTAAMDHVQALIPKIIALGEPNSVPAGQYATEALAHLPQFAKAKQIHAANARQVVQYLEEGAVEFGFIYASDALENAKIVTLFNIPQNWHSPIVYPAGVVATSKFKAEGQWLLDFFAQPETIATMREFGFTAPQEYFSRRVKEQN